ncbi:MAG: CHASE3 domain-containing protein [Deltaproteobacteria bacterium]|nr:CHASE3 domain-containing protein [Deltaproteobacteria bacterium]
MNTEEHQHTSSEQIARAAGAAGAVAGTLVLAGWLLEVAALKSILPGAVTMKPNTALAFALSGVALRFHSSRQSEIRSPKCAIASLCAIAVAAIGFGTLLEYRFGWDAGIDQLFFADAGGLQSSHPGRMAPATAINFVLLSLALLTMRGRGVGFAQAAALVVGLSSTIVCVGYVYDLPALYRLESYTGVALHTALAFLILSAGVLCATTDRGLTPLAKRAFAKATGSLAANWSVERATGVLIATALVFLVAVGIIAVRNLNRLVAAAQLRQHSHAEVSQLMAVLTAVQDAETGKRGYLITGSEPYLEPYLAAIATLQPKLDELARMATDDPEQQRRLEALRPLIAEKLAELREAIELRRREGFAAAQQLVLSDRGKRAMDHIRAVIAAMTRREQQQLAARDDAMRAQTTRTTTFIPLATLGGLALVALFALVIRAQLRARTRAEALLRDREGRLRRLAESGLIGVILADTHGNISEANDAFLRLVGYTREDLAAGRVRWADMTPAEHRAGDEQALLQLQSCRVTEPWEKEYVRKDGVRVPVLVGVALLEGSPDQAIAFVADLTERKRAEAEVHRLNEELEQRVALRTAQLEASNQELEAFCYTVAHDLRAPLRHVDGFAKLLLKRATALDDTATRYVHTMAAAATKMGALIDELLAFSRTARSELRRQPVALSALIEDIREELLVQAADRTIAWEIAPLPVVAGDPALLRLVWINLLSNAIKYTAPRAQARIEIGTVGRQNGNTVLFVRDNGVGFDMEYADKLFGVFQRLHPAKDFAGNGIGLATVRRIVHRHDGHVWAEGQVDGGATFYLALPIWKGTPCDQSQDSIGGR